MAFRQPGYYRLLTPIAGSDTDDRGDFRIPALDPDDYYIRVSPPNDRVIPKSYPLTYYPNTTDPAIAAKIVVSRGAEITSIDPRLPSRGVKVRGRLLSPKNDKDRAIVHLMPRSPSVFVFPFLTVN